MKSKARILAESGLKNTQVVDSIKAFVLPISEFLLQHSNLSPTKLNEVDRFFRKLINQKIGALLSPKKYSRIEQRMALLVFTRYMIDVIDEK
jgi:hypothetical protein